MLKIFLLLIVISITSCDSLKAPENRMHEEADSTFNSLPSPVILIGKAKSMGYIGITVKDGSGKITSFGNLIMLADNIGSTHNIGDTLR